MNAGARQSEVKVIPMVKPVPPAVREDEFLAASDLVPVQREAAERSQRLVLAEIEQLTRENRWADILAAFHPVANKLPELCEHGLDGRVREKIAFALGQTAKFDEAIVELQVCVQREPENFYVHASLAYTAYDSLYAAKNGEIFLSGKTRADRVQLAHEHFRAAQALRPDGVTNFYREGMLWKQIEGKPERGLQQKSVFECGRLTEKQFLKMQRLLEDQIDYGEDSVRYYPICRDCLGKVEVSGTGRLTCSEDFKVV